MRCIETEARLVSGDRQRFFILLRLLLLAIQLLSLVERNPLVVHRCCFCGQSVTWAINLLSSLFCPCSIVDHLVILCPRGCRIWLCFKGLTWTNIAVEWMRQLRAQQGSNLLLTWVSQVALQGSTQV